MFGSCALPFTLWPGRIRWALPSYRATLLVVRDGWVGVATGRLGFFLGPGTALWLPGSLKRWMSSPTGAQLLHVQGSVLAGNWPRVVSPIGPLPPESWDAVTPIDAWLRAAWRWPDCEAPLLFPMKRRVRAFSRILLAELMDDVSIDALCARSASSRRTVDRSFLRVSGQSARSWRTRARWMIATE